MSALAGAGGGREAGAASPSCYLPSSPNLSGWAAYHLESWQGMGLPTLGKAWAKVKVSQVKDYPVLRIGFTHQDRQADSSWSLAPSAGHTEAVPDLRLTPIP